MKRFFCPASGVKNPELGTTGNFEAASEKRSEVLSYLLLLEAQALTNTSHLRQCARESCDTRAGDDEHWSIQAKKQVTRQARKLGEKQLEPRPAFLRQDMGPMKK